MTKQPSTHQIRHATIQSLSADKGFGFARPEDGGPDVFVHFTIFQGDATRLKVGTSIDYLLDPDSDRPRAKQAVFAGRPFAPESPERDRKRSSSKGRTPREHIPENCSSGFVTKIRQHEEPLHGYVSGDQGGAEVRFEPRAVAGRAGFSGLRIGDYVLYSVDVKTADTRTPQATFVKRIERTIRVPRTNLPRHPKARGKKPSWRKKS